MHKFVNSAGNFTLELDDETLDEIRKSGMSVEDFFPDDDITEESPVVVPKKKRSKAVRAISLAVALGIDYESRGYDNITDFSSYCLDVCSNLFITKYNIHPSIVTFNSILLFRVVPTIKEYFNTHGIEHKISVVHTSHSNNTDYPDSFVLSIELEHSGHNYPISIGFLDKSNYKVKGGNEKYENAADKNGKIPHYSNACMYYDPAITSIALDISDELKRKATGKPARREKPTIEMIAVSRELYTRVIELDFEYDPDEDLDIHYGEGFGRFDTSLMKCLGEKNKGIIMLYGSPGTGKTHYIRRLIAKISREGTKRVILIPKYILEQIEGPQFNNFMTSNFMDSDALFVIEDAESIVSERDQNGDGRSSLVSTLLNISDGILNDIFKIQVILTFNTELSNIDEALLRPGRLIAQRYFDTLSKEHAQKLVDHLGLDHFVEKEMTVAEIYALNEEPEDEILLEGMSPKERAKIGF